MKRIFSCSSSQVAIEKWNKHDQKLFEAVENRDLGKIAALLAKKPVRASKPNPKGQSAFHQAAAKGLTECLNILLSHGVEINAKNDQGSTALHLASSGCHPDCVKLLLQRGANEESIDFHSRTALHCAAYSGCVSSVLLLCDQDEISLDASDDDGRTPLMIAAQKNHPTICSLLLERGALVNIIDKDKKTALILASEKGNVQAAETLLTHGADATAADSMGHDALYYASSSRDDALRRLLQGALDKRKRGTKTDPPLSRSQESVEVHAESRTASVPNSTRHDQQDEWRRKYEEERKKVSRLEGELLRKTHDHEVFAEGCRTERDKIKARVHEISGLLQGVTSEQMGKRKSEMRPLSQASEQPYFMDLLAGQVQAMKEKHQELEEEKRLLQEDITASMARREALAKERQQMEEKHQEEVGQLRGQVATAMEEKASAVRRVAEIEGHMDNMRSVLSQFKNRKRIQSSMMDDLNEHVFEMTSENERLKERVRTLEERGGKEETTDNQERALSYKYKNAQNILDSTVRELRKLLLQVPKETLKRELGDQMQSNLQPGQEPAQTADTCEVSWKKMIASLEHMLTDLEKSNRSLLEKSTQLRRATAPLQHEGRQGEDEAEILVNGTSSAHRAGDELLRETSNVYQDQHNEAGELQSKNALQKEDKGIAYQNQALDSADRPQDFVVSNSYAEMQEALSKAVELEKEVSDLTLENAGLLKELNDAGEEKEKLQGELHTLRRSLQTDFVPMEDVKGQLGELEQNVALLTDEVSTEQEKTRKLASQLESQRSEIRQLMDSFPPDIIHEEKSKDGKTFSTDVLEELFWNVGTLVRKHSEVQQQRQKLGQENQELKNKQAQCISIADHNEKLTSVSHKIDKQASEIEELGQRLSSANKSIEDLIAVTRKIDSQAKEIQALEQKLSNAVRVVEELTAMTRKIDSQAQEIQELEQKLSNANKVIEDLSSMTQIIDSQATEIQELEQKLASGMRAVEDLTVTAHKIEEQAIEIHELKNKRSNATKVAEDVTSMTQKIEAQTAEIRDLQKKLSSSVKAVEDLATATRKIEAQATEIQVLQQKLSDATKAVGDFTSTTHRIDIQATEIQEIQHKLSSASKAVEDLQKELLVQKTISINKDEHLQLMSALEKNLTKVKVDLESEKQRLAGKCQEIAALSQQLHRASVEAEELKTREVKCLQDHKKVKSTLEGQIHTLKGELRTMSENCEQARREVASWETKVATQMETNAHQSSKMIRLKEEAAEHLVKSETSQNTIGHLLEKVTQLSCVCQDKEKKIAELLTGLNGFSEEVVDLQSKHACLQLQLKDTQKQHQEIVSTYRTHLLHAAQGFMDEEVRLSLLRIRKMQDSMIS